MNTLRQETIDSILSDDVIISCGVDNEVLYIVTSNLDVRYIKPTGNMRPSRGCPALDGMSIIVYFKDKKNPSLLLSSIAIKSSVRSLSNASLVVNNNYICDVEIADII